MTTRPVAHTVADDETIQAIHGVLVELSETQTRLLTRRGLLYPILARRFDNRILVAPEVTGVSVRDASLEINEIDRQLAALAHGFDAQYGALAVADFAAQARILESVMPEYRQLATEVDRQAFLTDLRRRGVFQVPVIEERG
jgi:hypothetical protein